MNKQVKPPKTLKVIKIGNSAGVILPKEMLARLGVAEGEMLDMIDTPDGYEVRRHDGGLADQMEVARAVMAKRRAALRELAK